ncbi:MAG: PAS domain-containing protein, partial [Armatimonadota bacterium]
GLRELLVFSEQDLNADPPFSRLDLLSCRNLMIYLGAELQKQLIPLFHYVLNPGGVLFLGTSETVGEFIDLFTPLERKLKLYQRGHEPHGAPRPAAKSVTPTDSEEVSAPPVGKAGAPAKLSLRGLAEKALLQHYGSAGVLVNDHGDILYLHGRTGQYLEPAPGEAVLNVLKMAREGLRRDLTTALHQVAARGETVCRLGLRVRTNGDFSSVNLTVAPVGAALDRAGRAQESPPTSLGKASGLFLVILEAGASLEPPSAVPETDDAGAGADARILALQQELRSKDEYLQATGEELEATNEELRSSNEEMQSVNEELQSTNEELETSKEELQSVNEELATVNAELQAKVNAFSRANNDLSNLMAASGIGTIFVDHHLLIQRFTPAVTQIINLIQTDVGRPVGNIVSNLVGYDRLVADLQGVLGDLVPREVEVQTQAGVWYLLAIRPYRTLQNVIEGAVITFTNITVVKQAQALLREAEAVGRLATIARDSRDAIIMQDLEGKILAWNPAAARMYGWSEGAALTMNIRDLIPEGEREEALGLIAKLGGGEVLEAYRMQ